MLLEQDAFLRAIAHALTGDSHASEDVAQETWASMLRRPGLNAASWRAWIVRAARNCWIDARRARDSRREREKVYYQKSKTAAPSAAELYERESMRRRLAEAVFALPEPARTAVLLHYYEGMPVPEIAGKLNIPFETVRSRIKRGIEILKQRLDTDGVADHAADWRAAIAPMAFLQQECLAGTMLMITKTKIAAGAVAICLVFALGAIVYFNFPRSGGAAPPQSLEPATAQEMTIVATASAPDREPDSGAVRERLADAKDCSIELEAVYQKTGRPAANIGIKIVPFNASDPRLDAFFIITDSTGRASVRDLRPGTHVAYADRGGNVKIELSEGEQRREKLYIPDGVYVIGSVVSPANAPVAGAEIWLSDYGNTSLGRFITTSDAEGRFIVECVHDGHHVAARAKGFVFSNQYIIEKSAAGAQSIRIQLERAEAPLDGIVTNEDGAPVAGARVRAGPSYPATYQYTETALRAGPPPQEFITNEKGAFSCAGLGDGTTGVEVRAAGYAPWDGDATLAAGETQHLQVRLLRGVTIRGTVYNESGKPLAGAAVAMLHTATGPGSDFMNVRTRAAADGSYIFRDAPRAPVLLHAYEKIDEDRGAVAWVVPGTQKEVSRDLIVKSTGEIRGRVRDADGKPLAGLTAYVANSYKPGLMTSIGGGSSIASASTDGEGRFVISDCPPALYTLTIVAPLRLETSVETSVPRVCPGEPELQITVHNIKEKTARIRGRFVDATGAPARGGKVYFISDGPLPTSNLRDGAFESAPAPAGKYHIYADCDGFGRWIGDANLADKQILDLGDITLPRPGRLEINISFDPRGNRRLSPYDFVIVPKSGASAGPEEMRKPGNLAVAGRQLYINEASPGEYEIFPSSHSGFVATRESFEIRSGETTTLTIKTRPGAGHVFNFFAEAGAEAPRQITATIDDSSGATILARDIISDRFSARISWMTTLAAGNYKIHAVADDGRTGNAIFTVSREDEWLPSTDVRVR